MLAIFANSTGTTQDSAALESSRAQSASAQCYIRPVTTSTTSALSLSDERVSFAEDIFSLGELILIDNEIMLITADTGNGRYHVSRGARETTVATHASGALVYRAKTYSAIVLSVNDTDTNDALSCVVATTQDGLSAESATVDLGACESNGFVTFWRRFAVPRNTEAGVFTSVNYTLTYKERSR